MNNVEIIIRVLGISIKRAYNIPASIGDLTEKQYLTITRYLNGNVKEYRFIALIYNIPRLLAWVISRFSFWRYQLIVALENLCDLSKSCDHFLIRTIPGTKLHCDNFRFKGFSFMQFMYIDTMYSKFLLMQNDNYLYSFIAALYLKEDESFNEIDIESRVDYLAKKKISRSLLEAILLNYMMMKKWLSMVYPYMFSSDKDGYDAPKQQQKWLDIFDAFVGDNLPDTEYYKDMDCMDAFRIINRRIKEYQHELR